MVVAECGRGRDRAPLACIRPARAAVRRASMVARAAQNDFLPPRHLPSSNQKPRFTILILGRVPIRSPTRIAYRRHQNNMAPGGEAGGGGGAERGAAGTLSMRPWLVAIPVVLLLPMLLPVAVVLGMVAGVPAVLVYAWLNGKGGARPATTGAPPATAATAAAAAPPPPAAADRNNQKVSPSLSPSLLADQERAGTRAREQSETGTRAASLSNPASSSEKPRRRAAPLFDHHKAPLRRLHACLAPSPLPLHDVVQDGLLLAVLRHAVGGPGSFSLPRARDHTRTPTRD